MKRNLYDFDENTKLLRHFPPSLFFLIKMATNVLICHYIEVIKTSIITVLLAI